MIFVDTGYLIALLDRSDQHHAVARDWATVVKEEMLTTSFVFAEFFNYFSGSSLRVEAHKFCDLLDAKREFNFLNVDASLYERGRTLHRDRPDKAWSLTDCISFTAMSDHHITQALAYDHHFEQAGFHTLLRRSPP